VIKKVMHILSTKFDHIIVVIEESNLEKLSLEYFKV